MVGGSSAVVIKDLQFGVGEGSCERGIGGRRMLTERKKMSILPVTSDF